MNGIRKAAKKASGHDQGRRPLEAVLVPLGAIAVLAAIVGGGLDAIGVKVPVIDSLGKQILFGAVGFAFVVMGLGSRWMLIPALRRARRLERNYNDLILKTNDLRFAWGGILDLLRDYRITRSEEDWTRVRDRARTNEEKLTALRTAKDRVTDLAGDPFAAQALDDLLNAKFYILYNEFGRLPRGLPAPEKVDELIQKGTILRDTMTASIDGIQEALIKLRNEARDSRVAVEARIFP